MSARTLERRSVEKWASSRREFLKKLGLGAAMLPLLHASRSFGSTTTSPTRFVVFTKGNGMRGVDFWPALTASGSLTGTTLPFSTGALQPYLDRLLFPDGLCLQNWLASNGNPTGDSGNAHHDWGSVLTGHLPALDPSLYSTAGGCGLSASPPGCAMVAGGPSIDAYIGGALKAKDSSLLYGSLALGLRGSTNGNAYDCASWLGLNRPNTQMNDPNKVFQSIFAGGAVAGNAAAVLAADQEELGILNYVGKDIERFSRRLGTEDRLAVQAHLSAVQDRQGQLNTLIAHPLVCNPATPTLSTSAVQQEANTDLVSKLMMDMLVDSLKCGVTRVASYSLFDSNSYDIYFTWLQSMMAPAVVEDPALFDINFTSDQNAPAISEFPQRHYHSITHGQGADPGRTMYQKANRWHLGQLAYFLQRLASEPEGNGSMLDNTLILWADTLSIGNGHTVYRMPWLLAGNANGYFKTGRYVQTSSNAAVNGLFVSIANAMGVPPPNQTFGDPKFGSGELPGLRG